MQQLCTPMYHYVMLGFLARGTDGDVAGSRKSYPYAVIPVPPPGSVSDFSIQFRL